MEGARTAKRLKKNTEDDVDGEEYPYIEDPCSSFIDHTCLINNVISTNATPLLNRMKHAYRLMCKTRHASEISLCMQDHFNEEMILLPANYSTNIVQSRTFFNAMMKFARSTFDDIRHLPRDSLMRATDHGITSRRMKHMTSYTTFMRNSRLECVSPKSFRRDEQIEKFVNVLHVKILKSRFRQVVPSIDEYIALLGLAFWNHSSMNSEIEEIARRNREAILNELHNKYARNEVRNHMKRAKQVLGLLANVEEVIAS